MGQNFIACDRDQAFLLPPDMREWLAEDHLAWFVIDAVAALDLSAIVGEYREDGWGRPAHDPAMMVALLLYAYAVGRRSSRVIERCCGEDVAFRVIAANRAPDHATISRFRARHQEALAGLFVQVLGWCARAGLVSVGTIAIDGTKLAGDAALGANRTYAAIGAEVERILEEAAAVDAAEDERFGDARGDELPAQLADPKTRRARLAEVKAELEAEEAARRAAWEEAQRRRDEHEARTGRPPVGRAPRPPAVDALARSVRNTTDPDSRPMRLRGMPIQGYNAQLAATAQQVIVAAQITNVANDQGQLAPMLDATLAGLRRAGIAAPIGTLLADTGYFNLAAIGAAREHGIEVLIPPRQARPDAPRPLRSGPIARQMQAVLATPAGQARYRQRQAIVEPVFARIKHHRNITRLLRRGLTACQAEWQLIATTHNLLKLHNASLRAA